jgi:hypothetical protein
LNNSLIVNSYLCIVAEFSVNGGRVWYDISIIPTGGPGPGFCPSLDECKRVTGGVGFNLPMQMTPVDKADGQRCKELTCLFDGCPDAYLFPKDDIKTHNCPDGTNFIVTFCPGAPAPAGSSAPGTPEPEVAADLLDIPATTAPVTNPPTTPPTLLDSSSSEAHSVEHDVADDGNASSSGSEESHSVVELEASDSNTASTPATTDAPLKEVNTKSSSEGGSTVGVVLVCIFVLVGAVAAATIFTVRAKKRTLDEEPKSPAILDSSFIQIRL